MKRREFITLIGGAAAWPLAARAQQPERMRRIFVLMGTANDAEAQARAEALQQGLQVLGWTMGRNVQINYGFGSGDVERMRVYAKEAVASGPDLILAQTNSALEAVRNATPNLPIIFLQVSDPVGGGFVESLAHPGGNITGFTNFESEIGGKWLQTLKEIAPAVERVAVVLHPETSAHAGFLRAAETAPVALGIKVTSLGRAQRQRNRTRHNTIRPRAERRSDCGTTSRYKRKTDYRPGRTRSIACDLSVSLSR
jgi:putative tryptophan/tyrosine transport system substrate-binding protein